MNDAILIIKKFLEEHPEMIFEISLKPESINNDEDIYYIWLKFKNDNSNKLNYNINGEKIFDYFKENVVCLIETVKNTEGY